MQETLPPELQPALEHTLECVDEDAGVCPPAAVRAPLLSGCWIWCTCQMGHTCHVHHLKFLRILPAEDTVWALAGLDGESPPSPLPSLDHVWECLGDLLRSSSPWARSQGVLWLYLLLLTAAQHHMRLHPGALSVLRPHSQLKGMAAVLQQPPGALAGRALAVSPPAHGCTAPHAPASRCACTFWAQPPQTCWRLYGATGACMPLLSEASGV